MLLSDNEIQQVLGTNQSGPLKIVPLADNAVQPASVDLRLGDTFRVFNNYAYNCIDPEENQSELTTEMSGDGLVLHPGEFVLGSTLETVHMPDFLAGRLEGKSSLGRLGLQTHATAGFIDPGFQGQITLELSNMARLPIILRAGMKIGQLCLLRLTSSAARPYGTVSLGSKYQGQTGPTASEYHRNERRAIVFP